MTPREIATKVAWSYHGKPYLWGGDDPITGFDCSGYCIEIGKSSGTLPRVGDWSAAALFKRWAEVENPYEGCFVFYGNPLTGEVTHMEYCLDDTFCIGASGGASTTTNLAAAISQNAFIKVREIRTRPGLIGFVDPFLVGGTV